MKYYTESSGSYKFLHKDYLGSILAITDESGAKLEQRHYDAWGSLTHLKVGTNAVITDNQQLSTVNLLLDRGYTSHEHFAEIGIIHMNGRLYDPLLRRFLNADENIQDPNNTQNYNKYGYVMNNPLMYNDPSGEIFFLIPLVGYFWSAVIVGATIGLASYVVGAAITGQQITLGGALKSMFWGAVSGAATFGIGSIFSSSSGTLTAIGKALGDARILVQGAAHAISQGTLSLMQGGNFLSGAAAGFLGHLGAEAWGASMNGLGLEKFSRSTVGMIAFGAISGGIGAEFTGGNFWQGALTGGIVAGLNSAMHKIDGPRPKKKSTAKNSTISNKLKKYYNKISEFLETHGTSEASLSVKRGLFFDLGFKNLGQINLGKFIEDTWSSSAGSSEINQTNDSKFSAGIMAKGGVNYSYNAGDKSHTITLGAYTFAAEYNSKQGLFVGWNPGVSIGIGMGVGVSYKLGFTFSNWDLGIYK